VKPVGRPNRDPTYSTHPVIPAQAGLQGGSAEGVVRVSLDPRLRGDDAVDRAAGAMSQSDILPRETGEGDRH
jgi:hypothetical protein